MSNKEYVYLNVIVNLQRPTQKKTVWDMENVFCQNDRHSVSLFWCFICLSLSLHSIPPCQPAAQRRALAGRAARLVPDVVTPSPCVQMSSRTSETTGYSKPSARETLPRSNWHDTYWPAERWVLRSSQETMCCKNCSWLHWKWRKAKHAGIDEA